MSYFQKIIPLIFIQSYLLLVLILFAYGPWPWPIKDDNPIFLYLILCQVIMILGYISSNYVKGVIFTCNNFYYKENKLKFLFFITLFLSLITLFGRTGSVDLNIFSGLSTVGSDYSATMEGRSSVIEYLRMCFCVSLFMFIPVGIYEFKNLNPLSKVLFVLGLFIHVAIYIKMGTNKGLFDIILFLPWLYLIAQYKKQKKISIKKIITKTYVFLLLFLFAITFFTESQMQRQGQVGINSIQNMGNDLLKANIDKPDYISQHYYLGYLALTRYLTHGYYAFSQSFEIEYKNTFPFGSSMFLSRHGDYIFSTKHFSKNNFPASFEKKTGWSYQQQWHSIYSWLLSDFGLLGILILLFILSRKIAKYWILSIAKNDFMNVVKFLILIILFFYIPANNQIFQGAETSILFIYLFIIKPIFEKR